MNTLTPVHDPADSLRDPPHNYEAERALLGAILIRNRAYERVSDFLEAEHFADPVNGRVYSACAALIPSGKEANPITLKSYLETDDLIISAGGIRYLTTLAASAVTTVNAKDYGHIIHDLFQRREVIALSREAIERAYDSDGGPINEQLEAVEGGLQKIFAESGGQVWGADLDTILEETVDRWVRADKGEITGLPSDLIDFDNCVGLLQPGDLEVDAGRPGMGKTSLLKVRMLNAARHLKNEAQRENRKAKWVVIFSAEMSRHQLADGLITGKTGIAAPRSRRETLDENDWAKIIGVTTGELAGLKIHINDKPAPTLSYIRSVCRRFERDGGVGLIGVDYIQIMGVEKTARDQNRTQDVSGLARGLKDTAKLFHCPVIALSQLNRAVEGRADKRPQLSDLRESGEIEAAADIVVFLYRHEYYLEREKPTQRPDQSSDRYIELLAKWENELEGCRNMAEAIVQKCRFGKAPSTAPLHFDGARTWFSNAAHQDRGNDNHAPTGRPGSFGYGDN